MAFSEIIERVWQHPSDTNRSRRCPLIGYDDIAGQMDCSCCDGASREQNDAALVGVSL